MTAATTAPLAVTRGELARDGRNRRTVRTLDEHGRTRRRTVRTLDEHRLAAVLAADMLLGGRADGVAAHMGGGVAHNYGYPARTDVLVLAGRRAGREVLVAGWAGEISAQNASLAAAGATVGLRELWDDRYGEKKREEARSRARDLARDAARAGKVLLRVECSPTALAVLSDAGLGAEDRCRLARDLLADAGLEPPACASLTCLLYELGRGAEG